MMNKTLFNIITLTCLLANQGLSQNWLPVGSGLNCHISNYVIDFELKKNNDGLLVSGAIGNFAAGGICENRAILLWDGQEYSEVADQNAHIRSTLAFDFLGNTYGCGYFVPIEDALPNLTFNFKTTEGVWYTVPGGFDGVAQDWYMHNNIAYICGSFEYAGGQPCALVCSFDGNQVQSLFHHPSLEHEYANSVIIYQDTLFVGGNFSGGSQQLNEEGYSKCSKIANGQMLKVGQGFELHSVIREMEIMDDKLFLCGSIRTLGGNQIHSMMYYESGQVHPIETKPNYEVRAMRYYNGGLYVVGDFTHIGSLPCNGVARYDGQQWTCLCNHQVYDHQGFTAFLRFRDLEIWNDTLYIGGSFDRIGNTTLKRIAKLDMSLSEAFPVSVTEQQRQELKLNVYPNPTKHELNITLPDGANAKDIIAIYDVHGRLVKEQVAGKYGGNTAVDVSCLSIGMYVIRYAGKDVVLNQPFLKE